MVAMFIFKRIDPLEDRVSELEELLHSAEKRWKEVEERLRKLGNSEGYGGK